MERTASQAHSDPTEQALARHWRDKLMRLTREELAPLIGYSPAAIYVLETSARADTNAWRRYKTSCLAAQLLIEENVTIEEWRWGTN